MSSEVVTNALNNTGSRQHFEPLRSQERTRRRSSMKSSTCAQISSASLSSLSYSPVVPASSAVSAPMNSSNLESSSASSSFFGGGGAAAAGPCREALAFVTLELCVAVILAACPVLYRRTPFADMQKPSQHAHGAAATKVSSGSSSARACPSSTSKPALRLEAAEQQLTASGPVSANATLAGPTSLRVMKPLAPRPSPGTYLQHGKAPLDA